MDERTQKMRLIVYGAMALYEGQGLDMARALANQNRADLVTVLDAMTTALYWLQEVLLIDGEETA